MIEAFVDYRSPYSYLALNGLGRLGASFEVGSVRNLGRYAANWIAWRPKRPSSTAALT